MSPLHEEVVMGYIGGGLQRAFVERTRGIDPGRLLVVPIDVGKRSAAAMVCDFYGEVVVPPLNFDLDERGFEVFARAVAAAEDAREASWTRVGLEQAGHYHRVLLAKLLDGGFDVVLLNPAQVKENRAQDLLRSLKSDARDLGAMAELLIRGKGRPAGAVDEDMAAQAALVAHHSRRVKARTALKNQIHQSLDLVAPGLSACFRDMLDTKLGRLLATEAMTPARLRRLGPERLRAFCQRRGVRVTRPKVAQVIQSAHRALGLPDAVAEVHRRILAADAALLGRLDEEIATIEEQLAEVLPRTPAAILTTIPCVAVVRASRYGAGIGDPTRFRTSAQVYRMSGLVPKLYESAGRRRAGTHISREGKVELREAIIELGRALRQGHPDFARYARALVARGKEPGVVACALGHRANRVAFAMIRDQVPFDPKRW
jgi:transposase